MNERVSSTPRTSALGQSRVGLTVAIAFALFLTQTLAPGAATDAAAARGGEAIEAVSAPPKETG